jgi:hypothetical protein
VKLLDGFHALIFIILAGNLKCPDLLKIWTSQPRFCLDDRANLTQVIAYPNVTEFLWEYASKNFVVGKFYIKESFYTKIRKEEEISVASFIGSAGGQVGLFLGMSFVSIFEIIYHIGGFIMTKCGKWIA